MLVLQLNVNFFCLFGFKSNVRVCKIKGSKEFGCVDVTLLFVELLSLLFSKYAVAQCEKQSAADVVGGSDCAASCCSFSLKLFSNLSKFVKRFECFLFNDFFVFSFLMLLAASILKK